ncbi:MAG: Fe-S protein assembly co-chaperone HscB [Deltaproteobacteria bacterium]|nr:Fe-S protein assembly co-chaperone HscB [Deltaproteobacteria bacterium]
MSTVQEVRCWRCAHQHQATLFCPACRAIQLVPPQADYFSVLELPRHPALDEKLLAQRYYELSRKLHPDLYQTGTPQEQEASLKNTALLNRAYRVLRDPVQRGQYWLELHDEQLGKDNNRVPAKLAALVFAVHEQLEAARAARAAGKADEVQAELAPIREDLQAQLSRLRNELDGNFSQWNENGTQLDRLQALKGILSALAYLRTLLRDVEKESEASWNV